MKDGIEIHGFLYRAGSLEPFLLNISAPISSGEDDYFCKVHAPSLLKRDVEIFGIDAAQAHELAVQFVKSMLGEATIVDKNQDPVDW